MSHVIEEICVGEDGTRTLFDVPISSLFLNVFLYTKLNCSTLSTTFYCYESCGESERIT